MIDADFYKRYKRLVSSAVFSIVGPDQTMIDDITGIVWHKLLTADLSKYTGVASSTIVFKVARNAAVTYVRDAKRAANRVTAVDFNELDEIFVDSTDDIPEDLSDFTAVFNTLKESDKEFLLAYHSASRRTSKPPQKSVYKACYLRRKLNNALRSLLVETDE